MKLVDPYDAMQGNVNNWVLIAFCSDIEQDKSKNPSTPKQTSKHHDKRENWSPDRANTGQKDNQNLASNQTNIDLDVYEDSSSNDKNSNQEPTVIIKALDDSSKEQV